MDAAEAIAHAAVHGIRLLRLPTPFRIGSVNTYLLDGERPSLFDCGPNAANALNVLEAGLADLGTGLEELETIVISHQHLDHCGLAGPIAARTEVEIACLDHLAPVLETWTDYATRDDDYAVELMLRHGVEPHVTEALRAMADVFRNWGQPAPVDRHLHDGRRVELAGTSFEVHHLPGHSPSDVLLYDPCSRIALGGDHLLAETSSNAVVSLPLDPGHEGERPRPLLEYRRSLRATRELAIDVILGGHGPPVTDHRALIDERLARQERRAARFSEMLADGPLSAHELATAQWGRVAVTEAFATIAEVLGHLDLLLADGAIVEEDEGSTVRFRRA